MKVRSTRLGWTMLAAASVLTPGVQAAERSIEEIVVTAERKESSVQDTSISITAFTSEMMDDFGIRNQSDLQNLVPATTIQPYDSAVRGVGRNFRNLGGDPGVATYMNGIYSEDLYTATIGSFWDIDRIEVLRGPQGTLYGRNAVGGAMNFLYKKPDDEFDMSFKTVIGSYGTRDAYGYINGPIIDDVLNGRITASARKHDGWVEERGPVGPDLDSGDERNIAIQLEWMINDEMTLGIRQNRAKVDRVMGGADGGGLIVLAGENTFPGGDLLRDTTSLVQGFRNVNSAQTNPLARDFVQNGAPLFTFTNPATGQPIVAQRIRPGVDDTVRFKNSNLGQNAAAMNDCVFLDRGDIDGDDLCAFTNGLNNETFNQQGTQMEFSWDINDSMTFKYLFGYNDLLYERITDDDNSAGSIHDRQFYVNHEAEYVSHELQLFWDVGDNLTFTSGIFFYDAVIDQRYDFFSAAPNSEFTNPAYGLDNFLATAAPGVVPGNPPLTFLTGRTTSLNVFSARDAARASGAVEGQFVQAAGPWLGGDALGGIPHGINTPGTDLLSTNLTERDAFAAYTQGVWDINDLFTLTFGVRYAKDEIYGEENLAQHAESMAIANAINAPLGAINQVRGALDANLQPTGAAPLWVGGVPISFGAHRFFNREDDDVTWRLNLDYNINDDSMVYGNITTGYRSGGFNLAFFSQTPTYEPEELIAYEIGYKGQFIDNTLQLNASIYRYDYDTIHTRTEEACPDPANPTPASLASACAVSQSTTSVQAAPGAEINGLEFEVLWLATDQLTLGGNFSYTDTEYTETFFVVDGSDPTIRGDIYDANQELDRRRDVKGHQLPQVPETKASAYATYSIPLDGNGNLDIMGTWSYIDDVYFSPFQDPLDLAPEYERFDLRATWTSESEEWVFSAFVNNVFDEIGIRQILRHENTDGYRRTAQVTEPRVYGIEVTYAMQ